MMASVFFAYASTVIVKRMLRCRSTAAIITRETRVDADLVTPTDVEIAIVAVAQGLITIDKLFASTWNLQQSWTCIKSTFAGIIIIVVAAFMRLTCGSTRLH